MRVAFVVALAALLLGASGAATARAAESPEEHVERLAEEALNAYRGADYKRAVELLRKAYEIRQVPALLYNMAKAYDKLGDVDHAYASYRLYANSAAADPKLKGRAEARMAALEAVRRKDAAAAARTGEPPRPTAQVEPPPAPSEPPPPAQLVPPPPPQPSADERRAGARQRFMRDRHRARLTTVVLGGATVVFGAVAIGLSADALVLQGRFDRATLPADKSRFESDARVRAGVADGFWVATAATAAVTGYFLYRSLRHEPSSSLAWLPLATPTGAGLAARGRF
jgi:tetratricopeptide (TPR) repeat protein